jgi:hypothetical protein
MRWASGAGKQANQPHPTNTRNSFNACRPSGLVGRALRDDATDVSAGRRHESHGPYSPAPHSGARTGRHRTPPNATDTFVRTWSGKPRSRFDQWLQLTQAYRSCLHGWRREWFVCGCSRQRFRPKLGTQLGRVGRSGVVRPGRQRGWSPLCILRHCRAILPKRFAHFASLTEGRLK